MWLNTFRVLSGLTVDSDRQNKILFKTTNWLVIMCHLAFLLNYNRKNRTDMDWGCFSVLVNNTTLLSNLNSVKLSSRGQFLVLYAAFEQKPKSQSTLFWSMKATCGLSFVSDHPWLAQVPFMDVSALSFYCWIPCEWMIQVIMNWFYLSFLTITMVETKPSSLHFTFITLTACKLLVSFGNILARRLYLKTLCCPEVANNWKCN